MINNIFKSFKLQMKKMYIIYIIYDRNNHLNQKKIENEDLLLFGFGKIFLANQKQKIKLKKKFKNIFIAILFNYI